MIFNARLISYTAPDLPDGRGDVAVAGVTSPLSARVLADKPTRSQLGSGVDRIADAVAVIYAPPAVQVDVDGKLTFRVDGDTVDRTLQVISSTLNPHGHQTHFEILLRTPR